MCVEQMHVHFFRVVRYRWTVEKLDVVIDLIRDVTVCSKESQRVLKYSCENEK